MAEPPQSAADRTLGELVSDVSEKASLLVREEIELAKAEVVQKVKRLARGLVVGGAAAVFLVFSLIYFFHGLAYFFEDMLDSPVWVGYAIVFGILVLLGTLAALIAYRLLKTGSPPTPDLAIEEAKLTRETLEEAATGPEPGHAPEERPEIGR